MEILQFLLSFFASEYNGGKFQPVFNLLKENSFDIKNALKNADLQTLAPIISEFAFKNKTSSPDFGEEVYKLNPINNIADQNIINRLNTYFTAN